MTPLPGLVMVISLAQSYSFILPCFQKSPIVAIVETVNSASTIRDMPAVYHSSLPEPEPWAMSDNARKRAITAITDNEARNVVILTEAISLFIDLKVET